MTEPGRWPPHEPHEHLCRHCGEVCPPCWLDCGVERVDNKLLGGIDCCDKYECQTAGEDE